MNKILVTGGAGFLGAHLCNKLIESNREVICLDNLYTGRLLNIEALLKRDNFKFVKYDITNPIVELFLEDSISEIYNLACPASPQHYKKDAVYTTKTSVIGILNVLDLAKHKGASVLQASTSEVYGDPLVHPQVESYNGNVSPYSVRACYTEGKRCAESLCFDYHRQYGVDVKVARIFNTYGPFMAPDDGRVISNFIHQALENKDMTVHGDGTQTRSFCYVEDMIEGLMALMSHKQEEIKPVNIGNPQEIQIIDIAKIILNKMDSNSKIVFTEKSEDDPLKRKPNIDFAKNSLNWCPKTPLEIGLNQTMDHFCS